jgi:hypothetical protein
MAKRIIKRKSSPGRTIDKPSRKTRSELAGSFHLKARRESMTGEEGQAASSPRYIKEGGRVVNFGGQVVVLGQFGREEKRELLQLVENMGAAKFKKDKTDRIIRVKSSRAGFEVYTSKPNLAVAIGKKLHQARKGGELNITWSHYDQPVRVVWLADLE